MQREPEPIVARLGHLERQGPGAGFPIGFDRAAVQQHAARQRAALALQRHADASGPLEDPQIIFHPQPAGGEPPRGSLLREIAAIDRRENHPCRLPLDRRRAAI